MAYVVAIATLVGVVFTRDQRKLPLTPVTVTLAVFILWMCITSLFALTRANRRAFTKVMKIQLMIFVTLLLLHSRKQIELFVWVLVISLGFYGIKGGIFTLLNGGHGTVAGPPGGSSPPTTSSRLPSR